VPRELQVLFAIGFAFVAMTLGRVLIQFVLKRLPVFMAIMAVVPDRVKPHAMLTVCALGALGVL